MGRNNNNKKRLKINKTTIIIMSILITIALVIGGTAMWGVNKLRDISNNMYNPLPNNDEEDSGRLNRAKANEIEGFHLLLLGVDSREGENARSDTVILATVNPYTEEVLLTSLPRDTYVSIPGYGSTKLNHAMAYGNVPLAKETVERFLDIEIDHYMTIDFNGFKNAIDELDGVHINVDKDMRYYDPTDGTNINIKKGYQLLDGKNALDYVRFRNDSEADFGRIRRQQEFIRAITERATEFTSVTKVIPFVEAISNGIKTDIHPEDMESLIRKFFGVRGTSVHSQEVKSTSFIGNDGLWYVDINKAEREHLHSALEEFRNKKPEKALNEQDEQSNSQANTGGERFEGINS